MKTLIKGRPQGLTPEDVVNALDERGNTIEGYNDEEGMNRRARAAVARTPMPFVTPMGTMQQSMEQTFRGVPSAAAQAATPLGPLATAGAAGLGAVAMNPLLKYLGLGQMDPEAEASFHGAIQAAPEALELAGSAGKALARPIMESAVGRTAREALGKVGEAAEIATGNLKRYLTRGRGGTFTDEGLRPTTKGYQEAWGKINQLSDDADATIHDASIRGKAFDINDLLSAVKQARSKFTNTVAGARRAAQMEDLDQQLLLKYGTPKQIVGGRGTGFISADDLLREAKSSQDEAASMIEKVGKGKPKVSPENSGPSQWHSAFSDRAMELLKKDVPKFAEIQARQSSLIDAKNAIQDVLLKRGKGYLPTAARAGSIAAAGAGLGMAGGGDWQQRAHRAAEYGALGLAGSMAASPASLAELASILARTSPRAGAFVQALPAALRTARVVGGQ